MWSFVVRESRSVVRMRYLEIANGCASCEIAMRAPRRQARPAAPAASTSNRCHYSAGHLVRQCVTLSTRESLARMASVKL